MKTSNPRCSLSCQFRKDGKCSIGINCPGPDCNFRGYKMKYVKQYIHDVEQYQTAYVQG